MDGAIKRKWQIALRRYIIEGRPAFEYAPYFGLDSKSFREWIEISFDSHMNWSNFGKLWHIDHIVPVSFFDLNSEKELCLCWNFINIHPSLRGAEDGYFFDSAKAISFFDSLYQKSGYYLAGELVYKIKAIVESGKIPEITKKTDFLNKKKEYLAQLEGFSAVEMELINKGMRPEEAAEEAKNIIRLSSL